MHARRSTRTLFTLLTAVASLLALAAPAVLTAAALATPPLDFSANGRFLIQADGTPFFWTGDTNWRLYKLTREDVDLYLDDRAARGFNVIQGPVLTHSTNSIEFRNAYGASNRDPTHPDADWFTHIDYIVNAADQRGLYIALVAMWGDDIDALGSSQSQRVAHASVYGQWLGDRYRNNSNVIWIVAGEYNALGNGNDIKQIWNALGNGLRSGAGGSGGGGGWGGGPLITIHPAAYAGLQSSSLMFQNSPWLSFNMIQSSQSGNWGSGADNWNLVEADYGLSPVKPTFDAEAHYENVDAWNAFGVRRRAYWSVFAGAFGHTYGENSVCVSYRGGNDEPPPAPTDTTWDQALDSDGANDMRILKHLMESRPMLHRIPAEEMIITPAGWVPTRMIATRDAQRRYAMVYVPRRHKTFTVNVALLNGTTIKAWWYDCRNGATTSAGQFPRNANGGFRTFTTPNHGQDWVLVLDNVSLGYPRPGIGGPLP